MLAFYLYPFINNQKIQEYTKEDLMNVAKVEELFDYCQILEAYITKSGWDFLIQQYGWEGLYQINQKSDWIYAETITEFQSYVKEEMKRMPVQINPKLEIK